MTDPAPEAAADQGGRDMADLRRLAEASRRERAQARRTMIAMERLYQLERAENRRRALREGPEEADRGA